MLLCSFYRNNDYGENPVKGRYNSMLTRRKDGNGIIIVDNSIVLEDMEKLLLREFVCYGYNKIVPILYYHM